MWVYQGSSGTRTHGGGSPAPVPPRPCGLCVPLRGAVSVLGVTACGMIAAPLSREVTCHPHTPFGVAPPPTPSPKARPPRHPWGANSPLLGRGFPEPPPPLVASGLAHTVAPPFFITMHALRMRNISVIGSPSVFGHIELLASFGRVALVGLLRPVCCRARHHARAFRRSRYARQSGIGLRPHFLSAGALCCGALFAWFPYVGSPP